ncbi:MAG TPA: hypothetical protein VGN77_01135 [Steroidobacteraceae bacterium]|jgi:hypothetical protein|nr:hypothetical protein [Steroidobacteraceae bacterium]
MFEILSVPSVAQCCTPRDVQSLLNDVSRSTASRALESYDSALLHKESCLEVLLLIWDEMDDWISAARHVLRNLT